MLADLLAILGNADWLAVLKYGGAVLAGGYGLYATVTDFHTEKDGKKLLSRGGYIGIALLVTSALVSLGAEVARDRRERADRAAEQRAEAARRDSARAQELKVMGALTDQLKALSLLQSVSDSTLRRQTAQLARTTEVASEMRVSSERQALLLGEQRAVAFDAARLLYPFSHFRSVEGELVYRDSARWPVWPTSYVSVPSEWAGGPGRLHPGTGSFATVVRAEVARVYARWLRLNEAAAGGGEIEYPLDGVGKVAVYRVLPTLEVTDSADRLVMEAFTRENAGPREEERPWPPRGFTLDSVRIYPRSHLLRFRLPSGRAAEAALLGQGALRLSLAGEARHRESPDLLVAAATEDSVLTSITVDFVHGTVRRRFRLREVRPHSNRQVLSMLDFPRRRLTLETDGAASVRGLALVLDNGRRIVVPEEALERPEPGVFGYRLSVRDIEREPGEFAAIFRSGAAPPR